MTLSIGLCRPFGLPPALLPPLLLPYGVKELELDPMYEAKEWGGETFGEVMFEFGAERDIDFGGGGIELLCIPLRMASSVTWIV